MDVFEAINKRRSIRSYTGDPVSKEDIEKIVDAGRLAASGGNRQPWDFIVITNRATIDQLKMDREWITQAGVLIAVVVDPASRWWVEDGSSAVVNMLLAATALGYGSCWLGGLTVQSEEKYKELLGIPTSRRLFTLITIGRAAEEPPREKKPLEAVIHWEKF